MQAPLDRRQRSARRLRDPQARKERWMVDEYPAGYVAQLARTRTAGTDRSERRVPSRPYARSTTELSPAA
jgi:hypothetical protein